MIIPEEETLYIENKRYMFCFNISCGNNQLHVSCYNKDVGEYLFDNKEIIHPVRVKALFNYHCGDMIRRGGYYFLVKSHTKVCWDEINGSRKYHYFNSYNNEKDCFMGEIPFKLKVKNWFGSLLVGGLGTLWN